MASPLPPYWASALAETLGREQALALMRDLPQEEQRPAGVLQALARRFGRRSGAGVAVRLGEALFHHWPLPTQAREAGWRHLPTVRRVSLGLASLGETVASALGVRWRVEAGEDAWRIGLRHHWRSAPAGVSCALWQGFFQEALYWLAGKVYAVSCRVVEDPHAPWPCEFRIPFRPLY